MISDFFRGALYVNTGCMAFYKDRHAWKYAAIPLTIMTGLYFLFFWMIIHLSGKSADCINEWLTDLPTWLSWVSALINGLSYFLGIVLAVLLLGATVGAVYEMFGGLFFDSLVEYYEQKEFGIQPYKNSLMSNLKMCLDSLFFGIRTSIFFILLSFMSLFFPVVGQILIIVFMGYYMGESYMICSANNKGLSLSEMRRLANRKKSVVLGFGVTAYVLLLIPFATIFLLPGLVLGGSQLFNNELKESV